jgi:transcription initiation factor IIE alpha subunit
MSVIIYDPKHSCLATCPKCGETLIEPDLEALNAALQKHYRKCP